MPAKGVITVFRPGGYYTDEGYIGFLPDGGNLVFPTYCEYMDYVEEDEAA